MHLVDLHVLTQQADAHAVLAASGRVEAEAAQVAVNGGEPALRLAFKDHVVWLELGEVRAVVAESQVEVAGQAGTALGKRHTSVVGPDARPKRRNPQMR